MPKIDLDKVPVNRRLVYPEPFLQATAGYSAQRLGDAAGLKKMGINRVVLPPHSRTALRHWHEVDDEFVIVMEGEVVLHDDSGETILYAGDCAGFKAGDPNGHAFHNHSDKSAVLFEIGTREPTEIARYPDDALRYEKRDGKHMFFHRDGTPY